MGSPGGENHTDADAMDLAPTLEPGRVVAGRFRVERLLGSGGMGAVHEAVQLTLDRRVALKILHPGLTRDASLVARFRREAKTMAGLRHPNIVEVIDAGADAGLVFLVMEFLSGTSFNDWVESRMPCSPGELLPMVIPVGLALSFVHAKGIVHRDVKPDNVFLVTGEDGTIVPKLLDFGIARPVSAAESITATGMILGTPAYMAPEQAWGLKEITPAADQWAFGAMLYEALSGEIPHQCATPHGVIVKRVSEPPRPLRELRPDLDAALAAVVMRALEKDAEARFPSMDAMLDALAVFLAPTTLAPAAPKPELASTTVAPAADATSVPTAEPVIPAPLEDDASPMPAPTRAAATWARAIAGAALVALVVGFGVAAARREAPSLPAASPPPAPMRSTISLDFSPAEARIVLDGAELGAGHAAVEVARGSVHGLRVEADGYLPFVDSVRADGDVRISRSLVRREVDASAVAPRAGAPSERPSTTPARPAVVQAPLGRRPIDTRWPR